MQTVKADVKFEFIYKDLKIFFLLPMIWSIQRLLFLQYLIGPHLFVLSKTQTNFRELEWIVLDLIKLWLQIPAVALDVVSLLEQWNTHPDMW